MNDKLLWIPILGLIGFFGVMWLELSDVVPGVLFITGVALIAVDVWIENREKK